MPGSGGYCGEQDGQGSCTPDVMCVCDVLVGTELTKSLLMCLSVLSAMATETDRFSYNQMMIWPQVQYIKSS